MPEMQIEMRAGSQHGSDTLITGHGRHWSLHQFELGGSRKTPHESPSKNYGEKADTPH